MLLRLCRHFFTSLFSPSLDNFFSLLGPHSFQKAVPFLMTPFFGLICSLHRFKIKLILHEVYQHRRKSQ
jgi:hypothetical protein